MATSGSYTYAPSIGELGLYSLSLCRIRRSAVEQEHLMNLRLAANLMLSTWSNRQVNLWKVDLVEVPLLEGIATYAVDPQTILILDAYIRTTSSGTNTDRLIFPISRTEYASFPNKDEDGFPSVFWFDRLISPTLTLWTVPNGDDVYTLRYYRVIQVQDALLQQNQQPDIPYRWLEAFAMGLAARLAAIYAQDLAAAYETSAEKVWQFAASNDTENVPMYISPGTSGYYVR